VRKVQRLAESSTFRGRSLLESILAFIGERGLVTRRDVAGVLDSRSSPRRPLATQICNLTGATVGVDIDAALP
jgi:hypothetical protein